jgi:hypothetical protein
MLMLEKEFSPNGLLSNYYKQVEQGSDIDLNKLMR